MKKILILLLGVLLAFGAFSGCAGMYRPQQGVGGGNDEMLGNIELSPDSYFEGKLRIAAPKVASHQSALNAFIRSFEEKYPKIEVQAEYLDLNSYKASIGRVAASAVNNPSIMYDVFWLAQDYVNEWIDLDILSPLEQLMDKDSHFDRNDINAQMLKLCTVKDSVYMMPRDYNQVVMFYNKRMFDVARVDYPKDGMTGAEFKEMCSKLARNFLKDNEKKNDYGVLYKEAVSCIVDCNVAWSSLDYPLVKSFGGSVVNEAGEVVFESEQTANAIRYWKDLVETKEDRIRLAIDLVSGADKQGVQFRMQQAPIYLHSRSVMSDLLNEETIGGQTYKGIGDGNLGVAALPNFGGTYAVGAGCSGYAMYKNCANGTAAWQFLKHVVSIEGQNAYSETGDCVPVRNSLLNDTGAAWRTCLPGKLSQDFHHDAFIYQMDKACATNDFYPYIPFKSQAYVTARIEEAFRSCIQGNNDMFAANLRSAADKMKNDIAQALK